MIVSKSIDFRMVNIRTDQRDRTLTCACKFAQTRSPGARFLSTNFDLPKPTERIGVTPAGIPGLYT